MLRLALQSAAATEIVRLFRAELELCRVKPGEQILVFAEPESNPHLAAAFFSACQELGAEAFVITGSALGPGVPAGGATAFTQRAEARGAMLELMKNVDMIIDVTVRGLLFSDLQLEIQRAGTRILRIREPIEVLRRLFPNEANTKRVKESARILDSAATFHLTSDAGTDLRIERGDRATAPQYGYAEAPGRFDQWGTCLVGNPPPEDKANGRLVLNVGDVMFPFGFYCREPVTLDVDGGRIARVGGGLEAKLFQQYLDWAGDKGARVISHVGWGCDPRANWNALNHVVKDGSVGVEIRSAYGCLLIAFGANADLGGKTHTKSHFDLVARGVSYAVDGTTILDRGQFVPKELR